MQTDQKTVRVLIVDDQAPFRSVSKTVVGMTDGFEVVGEAESGEDAVRMAAELDPDLILMDINMPGINGIEAIRQIKKSHAEPMAFLLSTYAAADLPQDAHTCGAAAYINKEDFEPSLLNDLWTAGGDPSWRT